MSVAELPYWEHWQSEPRLKNAGSTGRESQTWHEEIYRITTGIGLLKKFGRVES